MGGRLKIHEKARKTHSLAQSQSQAKFFRTHILSSLMNAIKVFPTTPHSLSMNSASNGGKMTRNFSAKWKVRSRKKTKRIFWKLDFMNIRRQDGKLLYPFQNESWSIRAAGRYMKLELQLQSNIHFHSIQYNVLNFVEMKDTTTNASWLMRYVPCNIS